MSGLGNQHRNAIAKALCSRLREVTLTDTWQAIHRHFGIGCIEGRKLRFAPQDFELLLIAARHEFGGDPRESLQGLTRAAAASQLIDEKLAPLRPDDGFVLVKGQLPASLPQLDTDLALRVPLGRLDPGAIEQVLVVENLDSFDDCHAYRLPGALAGSLVLYRGHGGVARGTRRLLTSLPPGTPITVFADYDPAGLLIASTLGATQLLLPMLDDKLLAKGHREHFTHQYTARRYLERAELAGWQPVWEEMKERQLSIKQQHMLALGASLYLLPRHA